jgi:replicative DNA helicase
MIDALDAERFLIGSLFHNPAAIPDTGLSPDQFGDDFLGELFSKMLETFSRKSTFSVADFTGPVSFTDYVRYLAQDYSVNPSTDTIRNYAEIIRDAALHRRITDMADDIRTAGGMKTGAELLQQLSSVLDHKSFRADIIGGDAIFRQVHAALTMPAAYDKTGIKALDLAMGGGLYQGYTYAFCGAEKSGKTTLASTISYQMAENETPHLYIAMEMGAAQIEQRNIARDMGVNSLAFLSQREKMYHEMMQQNPRANLFYLDAPGATLTDIISAAIKAKAQNGIHGFIVDYWQLVEGQGSRDTEEKHLRQVAQGLANFARKNGLWCILLAQMNQDGKLFGGNGLRKACDQLYMIQQIEGQDDLRWLKMDASRYTMQANVGSEISPSLILNKRVGPYFEELR